MNRILIAAVALLTLCGTAAARAESNRLSAVEQPATTQVILSSPSVTATGSESCSDFAAAQSTPVVAGGVIPLTGSEAPVQTANSLPVGFLKGSPAYDYALSVQRTFASRMEHEKLTGVIPSRHPG